MSTKLDQYKIFCEVAIHQSFSKASKSLFMTQPAVSQSIMQLEKELGVRLFTRTSKGVVLTSEGKVLYEYTSSGINLIRTGEQKLKDTKNLDQGELKIGVGDTISRYYLLPYLEKFHISFPNIKFKIINRTTIDLCNMIKSGEIDIAICNLPIEDSSLEIIKCKEIQDIFVCGKKYKAITKQTLTYEELVKYPLILLDNKSNSREYVEKHLMLKGIQVNPEIELGSHDLLLEFSKIGLGLACVIKEFSYDYLLEDSLYEINLTEQIPKRGIGICSLKGVTLSPSSERFVEYLLKKSEV